MVDEKMVIPDDLKARLKKLAEASNIPPKSVMQRLKEIMDSDEKIATMEKPEFKIRYAVALLLREKITTGRTTDFYITTHMYTTCREIKSDSKYVGNIAGLVKKVETDENGKIVEGPVEFGAGTIWREGAKQLEKLTPGKVYKGAFTAEKNSWGWELNGNNPGFVEVDGVKFPTIEEFYKSEMEAMGQNVVLADMDMEQSQNASDVKILNVTILDGDIRERPDHSEYGYYDISDDSFISSKDGVKGQRLFIDPRDVKLETGCNAKIGTKIEVRNEKVQLTPYFIIPIGDYQKKTFEPKTKKAAQQESVSSDDLIPKTDDDFGTI
jgi:hypothetical protein